MVIKAKLLKAGHSIINHLANTFTSHLAKPLASHLESNKKLYLGLGFSLATSLLIDPSIAWADIDSSGRKLHIKLVSVGKWVIIVKGTIDAIQSVLNGDMQGAKKTFISYLLCFAIMLGLPWCLDEIEGVFK